MAWLVVSLLSMHASQQLFLCGVITHTTLLGLRMHDSRVPMWSAVYTPWGCYIVCLASLTHELLICF